MLCSMFSLPSHRFIDDLLGREFFRTVKDQIADT